MKLRRVITYFRAFSITRGSVTPLAMEPTSAVPEGMQSGWLALADGIGEGRVLEKSESIRALGAFSRPTENDRFSAYVNTIPKNRAKYFEIQS